MPKPAKSKALTFRALAVHVPLLFGLTVLWLALWGNVGLVTIITGVVFAALVDRVLYLPPVELSGRFNVLWACVTFAIFIWRMVVASVHVAWIAVNPRRVPKLDIVWSPLRTRNDFVLTMTSVAVGLIPGSLVVEVDREASVLYLHILSSKDRDEDVMTDLGQMREETVLFEELFVRIFGDERDIERVNIDRQKLGLKPILGRVVERRSARATKQEVDGA